MEKDIVILSVVALVAIAGIIIPIISNQANTAGQAYAKDYADWLVATPETGYTGSYQPYINTASAPVAPRPEIVYALGNPLRRLVYSYNVVQSTSVGNVTYNIYRDGVLVVSGLQAIKGTGSDGTEYTQVKGIDERVVPAGKKIVYTLKAQYLNPSSLSASSISYIMEGLPLFISASGARDTTGADSSRKLFDNDPTTKTTFRHTTTGTCPQGFTPDAKAAGMCYYTSDPTLRISTSWVFARMTDSIQSLPLNAVSVTVTDIEWDCGASCSGKPAVGVFLIENNNIQKLFNTNGNAWCEAPAAISTTSNGAPATCMYQLNLARYQNILIARTTVGQGQDTDLLVNAEFS